ncbi:AEC family transporter [Cribrihabitans neustonicus]|uniref:AEC family transporter n=1 Tax=Cribrihabitans neustonicus TaxID=1429085 RepID=UPI003B5AF11F
MFEIFSVTVPVYLIILFGYGAVRTGYVGQDTVGALSGFTIRISLPALIFSAIALPETGGALNWVLIAGYMAASLAALFIGYGVMRLPFRQDRGASWIHGLAIANSNSGFIGFSIASLVFPETALNVLAWIMIVENVVIIPFAIVAAESSAGAAASWRTAAGKAVRSFLRNPLVAAVALALALKLTDTTLPGGLAQTVKMVASAAPVVALFVVGGIIAQFSISPMWRRTAAIVLGKLVLHPALVFVVLSFLLGAADPFVLTAMLIASVPMLSIYPVLGAAYGVEQVCATALVISTAASFLTVSALIWGMEKFV